LFKKEISILLLGSLLLSSSILFSQSEEKKEPKHLITAAFGMTFIPKAARIGENEVGGVYIPAIGIDYFYRISPRWEIGTMIDLELADYIILHKNLNREKALVIALIGAFTLTDKITFYAGPGYEFESHKNLFAVRFGGEYAFKFKNNWILAPGTFYDIKDGYDSFSISIAFGKLF